MRVAPTTIETVRDSRFHWTVALVDLGIAVGLAILLAMAIYRSWIDPSPDNRHAGGPLDLFLAAILGLLCLGSFAAWDSLRKPAKGRVILHFFPAVGFVILGLFCFGRAADG
jgi:hypothetical protein